MNVKINDFLNKKNSLRNLSDSEFESIVDTLASQLELYNYHSNFSNQELLTDWNNLKKWTTTDSSINSTSRIGMKLCEQFFPNFYDIENSKGQSFSNLWNKDNLVKVLRWNRKSHSTPYLSELKRGIYFCCGLTKNTMYRPQMMKMACIKYQPKLVLDPCAGWGGRMLGAVSYGANYIAFEPNTKTFEGLNKLVDFLGIRDKVTLICDDVLNMDSYSLPDVDMILTSPPYFDLEVYTHENTQSIATLNSYDSWSQNFLKKVIELGLNKLNSDGVSCWNVGKVGKNDMNVDVQKYHEEFCCQKIDVLSVVSSKRQSNQNKKKNAKNNDDTVVFSRTPVSPQV